MTHTQSTPAEEAIADYLASLLRAGKIECISINCEQIAEQIAALPALKPQPAAGWQPIETAPRNSNTVLVAWKCELRGWTVKEAWWGMPYEDAPQKQCSWRYNGNKVLLDKSVHGLGASHWMHLPTPPEGEQP